ncbi:hypothetical protein PSMK_16660 [Phycisphaera mikurensis NBRC 102666]|uniref:Uncharacterized protein n=1 Tax=Phycisphaera mikurensis (strain NBRC 102666 / KCTC 22515 / FYK2301M01) TaxID=1142394 RepID=I0IEY7_PHYMF|nr:hypothetical protein PSMK_16660 [Phycisphaera mikurensis NBRC 102666]
MAPPPRTGWFQKLCRQAGLAIHHATTPTEKADEQPKVLLRRTTIIEEVEVPAATVDEEVELPGRRSVRM